jgi:glycosyltransferase involved in cell wall biosynthesis
VYRLLQARKKSFSMVLVGDGPARKELESLMPGATFLGHLEGRELSEAYASSDIFFFPSTTETFGNVTIEAMASGLSPIVADAGGSKMLVEEGRNGFRAKPNNIEDFYRKIVLLLENEKLRSEIRSENLSRVKNFTWEKVFDNFLKQYSELLKKKAE